MLWQGVFGLWRWLRGGRRSQIADVMTVLDVSPPGAVVEPAAPVVEAMLPAPIGIGVPEARTGREATPFWTAAGVRGILAARRPCLVASGVDADKVADATPAEPAPLVRLVDAPARIEPVAISTVQAAKPLSPHQAMADRLRQVREANRPVRNIPGLKRHARDVLARANPPAIVSRNTQAAANATLTEDVLTPNVRQRPVLVFAA